MTQVSEHNAQSENNRHWPSEVRLAKDRKSLSIQFETGEAFVLNAEYLRVESPSAEVQGHSPAERQYIGGKREVSIIAVEPVGHYAVRLSFDDLHSTGIYAWDYLYNLGQNRDSIWTAYLDGLQAAGRRREPAGRG